MRYNSRDGVRTFSNKKKNNNNNTVVGYLLNYARVYRVIRVFTWYDGHNFPENRFVELELPRRTPSTLGISRLHLALKNNQIRAKKFFLFF